jgi:L-methionine (R)-S-oxide reductase
MGFEEGECVKERKRLLNSLTEEIREILNGKLGRDRKLQDICRLLKENISYYDWVGFYLIP